MAGSFGVSTSGMDDPSMRMTSLTWRGLCDSPLGKDRRRHLHVGAGSGRRREEGQCQEGSNHQSFSGVSASFGCFACACFTFCFS
jgi:hypothetical protein